MSEAKVEQTSAKTLSFRCVCERCRLMRGEVNHKSNKVAFTLAEVLITLGIIGVVAALTLPSVINKYKEKQLATQIRKVYADISNAMRQSQVAFDGDTDYSIVFNPENSGYESALALSKYFKGSKVCESPYNSTCKAYGHSLKYSKRYTNGTGKGVFTRMDYPVVILNNGAMLYILQQHAANCMTDIPNAQKYDSDGKPMYDENGKPITYHYTDRVCALIYVDVNGVKSPNRYGQDAFRMVVEKQRLLPSSQPYEGQETLKNVLSGVDKFVYEDYVVGE